MAPKRSDPRISLQLLWRRTERGARGPKPGLTLERVVAAAVAIADEHGLAAVSMRAVADALGVGTMSLYRYVPGKAELIELMCDTVVAEQPLPGPEYVGWRARLERYARDGLAAHLAHPWLADSVMARPPLGPGVLRNFDGILDTLTETGLPGRERFAIVSLVGSYVLGAARDQLRGAEVVRETGETHEEWWAAREEFWTDYFVAEDHPAITRLWEEGGFEADSELPSDVFEIGLQIILDGVEARIAAL